MRGLVMVMSLQLRFWEKWKHRKKTALLGFLLYPQILAITGVISSLIPIKGEFTGHGGGNVGGGIVDGVIVLGIVAAGWAASAGVAAATATPEGAKTWRRACLSTIAGLSLFHFWHLNKGFDPNVESSFVLGSAVAGLLSLIPVSRPWRAAGILFAAGVFALIGRVVVHGIQNERDSAASELSVGSRCLSSLPPSSVRVEPRSDE